MVKRTTARGPINIALIKYWGKKDSTRTIPFNGSLSLTLSGFDTVTTVEKSDFGKTEFYLNGLKASQEDTQKVIDFTLLFSDEPLLIRSKNNVPTAAGLASSAAGFSALATALNAYFDYPYDQSTLTSITRLGSGSACRSLYSDLVVWDVTGEVYALPKPDMDLAMLIVIINDAKKAMSSREAMALTVQTSPLFLHWTEQAEKDLLSMKAAILNSNFTLMGELAEANAIGMHHTMQSAVPPIIYRQKDSLHVYDVIRQLRMRGIEAYATMDAGPNVKVLCLQKDSKSIIDYLKHEGFNHVLIGYPGEGASVLEST